MHYLVLFLFVFGIFLISLTLYGWAVKRQEKAVQSCAAKSSSDDDNSALSCDICSLNGEHPDCS